MSTLLGGAREKNLKGAEVADTPILCETCLGPNPYIRMSKQMHGSECKICKRPFTVFRWNPGQGMRFKRTEVCTTCAKVKNVCQTCVLDLQYGLPVQVRDAALGVKNAAPTSNINREYFMQNIEAKFGEGSAGSSMIESAAGPSARAGQELLRKLARTDPEYKRNRAHLCSFYAKGKCTRGDECPFRHEMPRAKDDPLSKQNIQDRFYGRNDPVANRILDRHQESVGLQPPVDPDIMSLFLSSLSPSTDEASIRTYFVSTTPSLTPDSIKSITLVPASHCAFVNFASRKAAEAAAARCAVKLILDGTEVRVSWGRSKPKKGRGDANPK